MNVWQQYYWYSWLYFPAESGIAISRFRPETEKIINPINLVNPVQYKNYNSAEPEHKINCHKGTKTQKISFITFS